MARLVRKSLSEGRLRACRVGRAKMVEGASARRSTSGDEKYMVTVVCVDVLEERLLVGRMDRRWSKWKRGGDVLCPELK